MPHLSVQIDFSSSIQSEVLFGGCQSDSPHVVMHGKITHSMLLTTIMFLFAMQQFFFLITAIFKAWIMESIVVTDNKKESIVITDNNYKGSIVVTYSNNNNGSIVVTESNN